MIYSNIPCFSKSTSRKHSDFTINVLGVKTNKDIEIWVKSDLQKRNTFKSIKKLKRGIKVKFPVILTFKKPQLNKKVLFKATYTIITPDKKNFSPPVFSIANRVDSKAPKTIVLVPILELAFDNNDKNGKYILKVKVINLLDHFSKTLNYEFEIY